MILLFILGLAIGFFNDFVWNWIGASRLGKMRRSYRALEERYHDEVRRHNKARYDWAGERFILKSLAHAADVRADALNLLTNRDGDNAICSYISTYIPPFIDIDGDECWFQIFVNHAHYDLRFCYRGLGGSSHFEFLTEGIETDTDLLSGLIELRNQLRQGGYLTGEYATPEGWTREKHLAAMKKSTESC